VLVRCDQVGVVQALPQVRLLQHRGVYESLRVDLVVRREAVVPVVAVGVNFNTASPTRGSLLLLKECFLLCWSLAFDHYYGSFALGLCRWLGNDHSFASLGLLVLDQGMG